MTVAEQKAELLDNFINHIHCNGLELKYMGLVAEYNNLKEPPTFTEDPYIDEVFDGRIITLLKDNRTFRHWNKNMRVSDLPKPELFENAPGWGKVAIRKYTEVFNKYRG